MQKIIEYKIVAATDEGEFVARVNEAIAAGYQPYGYLQLCSDSASESILAAQAMVKYQQSTKDCEVS